MNFTLPLLTFIWIATGQPIDQVKHPKPTPKVTAVTKQQKAKHQEVKAQPVAQVTHVNMLEVNGHLIPVGTLQARNLFIESAETLQAYIDQGLVGQAWYELDNHDGRVTYMAGHNPGVFSPLAQYAQIGRTFRVWDKNGTARTYRFDNVYETSMYAREEENVNDEVVNYMHQHMEDHEGIILQWCRSERGVMQVWLASPVD